ncbi:MAG: enoyl-CoA hydratase/isomerase family protein [Phycisphaerales bacterium]
MSAAMVRVEEYDGITVVVLSRPERRNALTPVMFDEMRAALPRADGCRGLVLAGDGPVFCGGFDLKLCGQDPAVLGKLLSQLADMMKELAARDHPVVIAAKGAAVAGGAALLCAADIAVGDRGGQYGYPVVKLGLSPGISFPHLRTVMSDGAARERQLDSGLLTGVEAYQRGLLGELCDIPEDVGARSLRTCKALAAKPREAFAATKRLVRSLAGAEADIAAALACSLASAEHVECRDRIGAAFGGRPTGP